MISSNDTAPRLILASASPRRCGLLAEAGFVFEVIASHVDEETGIDPTLAPVQVAEALALAKARDVADRLTRPAIVLGADTLIACEDRILGKAQDADHARWMLHKLSHTRHAVITGIALVESETGRTWVESATSWITMRPMSPADIEAYIAGGAWIDKAGSYAVQEGADKFITHIDGSYTNVVGLPMELAVRMLADREILPGGSSRRCSPQ
jgi:septum formation protein